MPKKGKKKGKKAGKGKKSSKEKQGYDRTNFKYHFVAFLMNIYMKIENLKLYERFNSFG